MTWHGSDIHTEPFINNGTRNLVISVMQSASCNFFVSQNLIDTSEKLWRGTNKMLLYNGVESRFRVYEEQRRHELRHNKYMIDEQTKIIAFVGGLVSIKNVELLPIIFHTINGKAKANIEYWIIGDGRLRNQIETSLKEYPDVKCRLWGNQPGELMPEFFNVIDLLLLPSKNEGMPLVTLEALSCGANVIGSDVGGIKESIGEEYVVALDDYFVENYSTLAAKIIDSNKIYQPLKPCFSWEATAKLENVFYNNEFRNNN